MSTTDYTRNAHRRTIWAALQRYLMDYIDSDTPANQSLVCEEAFFSEKEVSQESFLEVFEELQRREADERIQMTQYEFKRRDVHSSPATHSTEAPDQEPKPQRGTSGKPFRVHPKARSGPLPTR